MCGQLLYVVEEGGLIGAQRGINKRSGLGLPYGGGSPARGNDLSLTPRQPHRPWHLASKAQRVYFSCILLRCRCRNLRQTNGVATSPCSVSRRFTICQLMLSLLSPEKAKGRGVLLLSPP